MASKTRQSFEPMIRGHLTFEQLQEHRVAPRAAHNGCKPLRISVKRSEFGDNIHEISLVFLR
jgi:hypothetical protein